jgi:hypothetical protein
MLKEIVCLLARRAEEIIADRSSIDEAERSQQGKYPFRQRFFVE